MRHIRYAASVHISRVPRWLIWADHPGAQVHMCAGVRIASWSAGAPDGKHVAESWRQAVQYLDPVPVAEVRAGLLPRRCVPCGWQSVRHGAQEPVNISHSAHVSFVSTHWPEPVWALH